MSNPNAPYTTIGTITVQGGERRRSYEVAAWWTRFVFETQTVELRWNGYYVSFTVAGRDVEEYFPSLFGGVPTGGGKFSEIDREATFTSRIYSYEVAEPVFNGERDDIVLNDDVVVVTSTFDHPIYDTKTHYKFFQYTSDVFWSC